MTYTAPVSEMMFLLRNLCDLDRLSALPGLEDATPDTVEAILEEAGKFASTVLAPLNREGDLAGLGFDAGAVTTPAGWKPAYAQLTEGGWNAPSADPEFGGMGLPIAVNACIMDMFSGANTAFQLCPMLTQGAIEAISHYASDELKAYYLPRLVSGEWTGTMNLTEPQAGSDLAAIRSMAIPDGDTYRIKGQKIFITYGEHDLTDNIVHLVLARLPDAPAGVKGISLFIVPKILPDTGERNDVTCVSIEHKLGIHASPTCTLSFGDNGGAKGWLVGEPNKGLAYMFAMMNNARLAVGLEGIGIADHAGQIAAAYAAERKQGSAEGSNGSVAIMRHPDVRRMLGLIRSRNLAVRGIALRAATAADIAARAADPMVSAKAQRRLDLLIPVVKGWGTELGVEAASLAVQVHGGMGFIEETGIAQHYRDVRITAIYEGTTGIQALDLIGRKVQRDRGAALLELIADMRATEKASRDPVMARMVGEAADMLATAGDWLIAAGDPDMPRASSTAALELFGICIGAWIMADVARSPDAGDTRKRLAAFYAAQVFPKAAALVRTVVKGAAEVVALCPEDFGISA